MHPSGFCLCGKGEGGGPFSLLVPRVQHSVGLLIICLRVIYKQSQFWFLLNLFIFYAAILH